MPQSLNQSFRPCPLLTNQHLQTLLPRFFKSRLSVPTQAERLELADGDFLDLTWSKQDTQETPLVILFHGLEGSINSPYIRGLMNALHEQNFSSVLMHFRGCSAEHNRLERSYHSGETNDIRYVINTIHSRYPGRSLYSVGFSLGGNALLKYLAEEANDSVIEAAIAVSVPFQLNLSADKLNKGFSRFYQWYLVRSLINKVKDKYKQRPAPFELNRINSFNTFWLFDDQITAPLHGFKSAREYYELSSCRQFLHTIETPTLIIQAADDPFLPEEAIPAKEELSPSIQFQLTRYGGHVGFISGANPFRPKFWLNERIPEYFDNFNRSL